jgi:hypothetical protein
MGMRLDMRYNRLSGICEREEAILVHYPVGHARDPSRVRKNCNRATFE